MLFRSGFGGRYVGRVLLTTLSSMLGPAERVGLCLKNDGWLADATPEETAVPTLALTM